MTNSTTRSRVALELPSTRASEERFKSSAGTRSTGIDNYTRRGYISGHVKQGWLMVCTHCKKLPASGVWEVETKRRTYFMQLCAACGMCEVSNRVKAFEDPSGELIFYRDVKRVTLLQSFNRPNTPDTPGGLKPDVLNVAVGQLSKGTLVVQEFYNARKRTPSIHPSLLNRLDWSYNNG